jgi:hypothetical protein
VLDWPHHTPYPWQEWEPVRPPFGPPWLSPLPIPVKVARTYVAAEGPGLLRAADKPAATIFASARRGPAAGRRSR